MYQRGNKAEAKGQHASANKKGSLSCLFRSTFSVTHKLHRSPKNHFFRWANLLRNFSTRPPSESTLFCVPV